MQIATETLQRLAINCTKTLYKAFTATPYISKEPWFDDDTPEIIIHITQTCAVRIRIIVEEIESEEDADANQITN